MVKINGAACDAAGQNLRDFLESSGYGSERVAVERNGKIVPKADYKDTIIADGDELEVVRFVGGG